MIPESRYKNLLGSLQGSYDNKRTEEMWRDTETQAGDYRASLQSLFGYNSESSSYDIHTFVNGTYTNNTTSTVYKNYYTSGSDKNTATLEAMDVSSSGQYAYYLTPDEVYVYGSAGVTGSYSLNRQTFDTNGVYRDSPFDKRRMIGGSLGGGIGIGKMREASAVFAVVRIVEKLQEDGYLTRELTKDELLEIIAIYARRIELTSAYERPTKYFVSALLDGAGGSRIDKGPNRILGQCLL